MKELKNNEMTKYIGGSKCIYHGLGMVFISGLSPLAAYWAYKNGNSFRECLYGDH